MVSLNPCFNSVPIEPDYICNVLSVLEQKSHMLAVLAFSPNKP